MYGDYAFAPYGEIYDTFGTVALNQENFTGDTPDLGVANMFHTDNRELNTSEGRWISPDPAGAGWNLYAYATNPNSAIDPSGLCLLVDSAGGCNGPHPGCGAFCRNPQTPNGWIGGGNGLYFPDYEGYFDATGTVGADAGGGGPGPGNGESVTITMWTTDNDGNQWFSTDNGQTWDMQIYGLWGSGGEVFGAGNVYQGSGVDNSVSVQVAFYETDGTKSYLDVNPAVDVSFNQTFNGPTPDQTVLFNASGTAGTNSVGTSIVQNPDGSIQPQGTTFSEGPSITLFGPWQVQFPLGFGTPYQYVPIPMTVQTNFGPVDLDP